MHADCLEGMRTLNDESFKIVITSPPYNIKNSTGNGLKSKTDRWKSCGLIDGYAEYDDNLPHHEYVEWQRECLTEMMRLIPDDGAIFYNHKWRVQNGLLQDRHDIVDGFPVRQIIIWQRAGGINFNDKFFLPTYEVIYLIAKKDFQLNRGANGVGDIWKFPQETKNPHPAPMPVPLVERIIESATSEWDQVLDPFMGSGTTGVACKLHNRCFTGIELSKKYHDQASARISDTRPIQTLVDLI